MQLLAFMYVFKTTQLNLTIHSSLLMYFFKDSYTSFILCVLVLSNKTRKKTFPIKLTSVCGDCVNNRIFKEIFDGNTCMLRLYSWAHVHKLFSQVT